MKVNELRIGNIVGFKDRTDFYARINDMSSLGGVHISRFWEDGVMDDQPEVIEDLTPIPLTEEWLLKFGFEKQKDQDGDAYGKELIYPIGNITMFLESIDSWEISFYKADFSLSVQYVHQLQNLYFALTGEEL
jgi:hypothetical protein